MSIDRSLGYSLTVILVAAALGAQAPPKSSPPKSPTDWAATVERVRHEAAITFSKEYQIKCPLAVVEKALDHPALMGALWDVYGYAPAYKITGLEQPGAVHIDDPTGIVGELWPYKRDGPRRIYIAQGKLDHWAVPSFNGGLAVFELETTGKGDFTAIKVKVFIEPESGFAGALLSVLEPLVIKHVDNRVTLNLEDAAKIMEAISQEPEAVADRLEAAGLQREFSRIF